MEKIQVDWKAVLTGMLMVEMSVDQMVYQMVDQMVE